MQRGRVLDYPAGAGRLSWRPYNEGFDVAAADTETEIFVNPEIPVVHGNLDGPFP